MTVEKCKVVEHRELGSGYFHIVFDAPGIAGAAIPGQFVHVRVPGLEKSALRRPFSVFNAQDGRLELLYKSVGRGAGALDREAVPERTHHVDFFAGLDRRERRGAAADGLV